MQQIQEDIYITNSFPGVTLGALTFSDGTILIDAPPQPEDGRTWQGMVRNLGGGVERLVVCLDAHFDRTIGLRMIDNRVLVHENTALNMDERSAVFKVHNNETGADWENCEGLGGIRWLRPHLTFTNKTNLHWGPYPITVEHHPGPTPGAAWLVIDEANVVFVGDAVCVDQPPFLAQADIPLWLETLDILLSEKYKDFRIISGRGGLVTRKVIQNQKKYLKTVLKHLEKIRIKTTDPEETETLVPQLLESLKFHPEFHFQYAQRLRYGLFHYFDKHYVPKQEEEE
jgi:glyoxylase-like metal-dependent hydrolase (beta-lactamase superfamily II)